MTSSRDTNCSRRKHEEMRNDKRLTCHVSDPSEMWQAVQRQDLVWCFWYRRKEFQNRLSVHICSTSCFLLTQEIWGKKTHQQGTRPSPSCNPMHLLLPECKPYCTFTSLRLKGWCDAHRHRMLTQQVPLLYFVLHHFFLESTITSKSETKDVFSMRPKTVRFTFMANLATTSGPRPISHTEFVLSRAQLLKENLACNWHETFCKQHSFS